MKTFSVKNYSAFQHYRDRAPPWIKFYNRTLDDYEIGALPDATKAHLFAIWLLASRYDNLIPYDQKFVERKINATTKIDLKLLEKSGFIVVNQECSNEIASLYQDASEVLVQRREEGEGEGEKKREDSSFEDSFEVFWKAYPKRDGSNPKSPARIRFLTASKDTPADQIIAAARIYASSITGDRKFVAQAITWLNQKRYLDSEQQEEVVDPALVLAGRARMLKMGIQGLGSTILSSEEVLELVREGHLTEEEGKRFST